MQKITKVFTRLDPRGLFVECISSPQSWKAINAGKMRKNAIMGNHYHKKTTVLFFLLSGTAQVAIKDVRQKNQTKQVFSLTANQGVIFSPYETHAITFTSAGQFILLKNRQFSEKNQDLFSAPLT